jgi:hypothetical protein
MIWFWKPGQMLAHLAAPNWKNNPKLVMRRYNDACRSSAPILEIGRLIIFGKGDNHGYI